MYVFYYYYYYYYYCFAVLPISSGEPTSTINATQATIGWSVPNDTDILTGYSVKYESVPLNPVTSRRKQATTPSGIKSVEGVATTSTQIPTCACCNVTCSVYAVYMGGRTAPLLQPTTFQTPEAGMYVR